jgi:hypothetical protein
MMGCSTLSVIGRNLYQDRCVPTIRSVAFRNTFENQLAWVANAACAGKKFNLTNQLSQRRDAR